MSSIGAFLEKFFGLGKLFYQEENDKYAKYEYYGSELVYDIFLGDKIPLRTCKHIDIINMFCDDKSNFLLLEIVGRDNEKRLFSVSIPKNEELESTIFNFLVAVKKAKAKCLIRKNPKLAEKKDELISLIDKAIVVKDNSNKLNINNIHMGKEVLGQIIDDFINETKEIAKIEDIVSYAVGREVDLVVLEIKDKILSNSVMAGTRYSELGALKDRFLGALNDFSKKIYQKYYMTAKLLEDIYRDISKEFKKQNIDEIKLNIVSEPHSCEECIVRFVREALEKAIEINTINLK